MNLELLREQLQENLVIYLDGMSDEMLDGVCQIIVSTFNELEV